jgi:16S rRNA (guanine(966)-N(2))-methyltransferase RsmD
MGAEALCRGAAVAVAIEQSAEACQVVRQNWQQVARPEQQWQVIQGDVVKRLATLQGQQFDRIYFDPPYAGGLYEPVLDAIAKYQLLVVGGEMAVEHSSNGWAIAPIGLTVCREKRYGSSALTFYELATKT